ncbi:hypothetical protein ACO2Q3_26120 [Caulobacter sp. KR2-114]|uniref:hypothetical protein n=1 Tax=Caulobacter sp. KR2-114 TaxID=3400912 RepID=UPI003BFC33FD
MAEPHSDLREAARFSSYTEAQVAVSALRAAGLAAVLLDADPVAGAWREPFGRGGYRVAVPEVQLVEARLLLRGAEAGEPDLRRSRLADAPPEPTGERLFTLRLILIAVLFAAVAAAALVGQGIWR